MKRIFLVILAVICYTYSCTSAKKATAHTAAQETPGVLMDKEFRKPIRDKQLYAATPDLVFPDTVYIIADTMHILTKKVQGCNAENFKLLWNGAMLKSMPPQTNLTILQVADAECKQKNAFHLIYNLAPLKYKNDSVAKKQVILHLRAYPHTITYNF